MAHRLHSVWSSHEVHYPLVIGKARLKASWSCDSVQSQAQIRALTSASSVSEGALRVRLRRLAADGMGNLGSINVVLLFL